MYIEEKQIREELIKSIEGKEKSTGKWDDILSAMAALPFCSARPEHRTLAPVAKVGVQLCQYLRSVSRSFLNHMYIKSTRIRGLGSMQTQSSSCQGK